MCGSDFQGIGEPFKRNCPSGSAASPLDLNVSAGDPHRVARDCLPSGRPPASPGPDVAANATRSAAAAVDIVFTAAGATANYRRSLLQRALRDIHAVSQHIGAAPLQYGSAGRMLLGLPPLNPLILF